MILITGGSGFIGSNLYHYFSSKGYQVIMAPRNLRLGPKTDWGLALEGVHTIIHTAALAHDLSGKYQEEDHLIVNALGTQRLAQVAAQKGVRRFIFLSTVKVLGEETLEKPFSDADPPNPQGIYARSKLAAEFLLKEVCLRTNLEYSILRLPLVYGPGVKANFATLMQWVARGIPLPFAGFKNKRSFLGVGILATIIEKMLEQKALIGKTLLVSDGESYSTAELISRLGQVLGGRTPRLWQIPMGEVFLKLVIGKERYRRLAGSLEVDPTPLFEQLGYKPTREQLYQELERIASERVTFNSKTD